MIRSVFPTSAMNGTLDLDPDDTAPKAGMIRLQAGRRPAERREEGLDGETLGGYVPRSSVQYLTSQAE